jgi:hypothetical protein
MPLVGAERAAVTEVDAQEDGALEPKGAAEMREETERAALAGNYVMEDAMAVHVEAQDEVGLLMAMEVGWEYMTLGQEMAGVVAQAGGMDHRDLEAMEVTRVKEETARTQLAARYLKEV